MAIHVEVLSFSGPMDLLLSLIEKQKIDIADIEIHSITASYLEAIASMTDYEPEEMTDFIYMASTLLEIKSRALLPQNKYEEEPEITKEILIQRLEEYKRIRALLPLLIRAKEEASAHYTKLPEDLSAYKEEREQPVLTEDIEVLQKIFLAVLERNTEKKNVFSIEKVMDREEFSLEETIDQMNFQLRKKTTLTLLEFIGAKAEKKRIIICFLAVLELIRQGRVHVSQEEEEIYIRQREEEDEGSGI